MHDAARADMQSLNNLLRGDGGSKKKNFDRGCAGHDGAHRLQARQAGHLHVEQQNIRLQFERVGNGLVAIAASPTTSKPSFSVSMLRTPIRTTG